MVRFTRLQDRETIFLLLLIVVVAIALRFVALDRFPPGLYYDEAANAVDALHTLRTGNWPAFYGSQGGKEALWMWLLAGVFWVSGVGILQIRLLAALLGLLTVGAVWWVAYELFSTDEESPAPKLALLSAAILATLFVHVHFSRDGFRLLTQPLVGSLALAALWRGLRGKGVGWFVTGGALLGLAMYTYSAARFFAVLLIFFFPLEWLISRARSHSLLPRYFWLLAETVLAAILVFAPMGLYFVSNPDLILHRADEVSFLNPTWNQGRPWFALFDSTWRNFAGLIWQGTDNDNWNVPGRPMLDPVTIPLFLLGVAIAITRWRRPAYLFLMLWLVILYLPAILSYDRVPTFHRSQGAVPAIVMLVAVGAWSGWQWVAKRLPLKGWGQSVVVPLLIILLVSGSVTAYDYFVRWGSSWDAYSATQLYYLELVEHMNQEPEEAAIYLFPYDLRNGLFEHPDLQLFYHGASPYISITDHEGKLFNALTESVTGREVVRVVDWKIGRSQEADPKRLIPALLTMYGQPLGVTADTPAYQIESFRLVAPDVDFGVRPPMQPVEMSVGDGLILQAFSFGEAGHPKLTVGNPLHVGKYGWVLLTWKANKPTTVDYKVSMRLVGEEGVRAQNDKLLYNSFHLGTTQWHPNEENFDLYLLPLEEVGQCQLQIIVYDPITMQELPSGSLILPVMVQIES